MRASSAGRYDGTSDYLPFVTYMLGVMTSCYKTLDDRHALLSSRGSNEDVLRVYFDSVMGRVTKRQILDDNPVMSQRTVERILQKMQAEGYIEKVGAARATAYRKVWR